MPPRSYLNERKRAIDVRVRAAQPTVTQRLGALAKRQLPRVRTHIHIRIRIRTRAHIRTHICRVHGRVRGVQVCVLLQMRVVVRAAVVVAVGGGRRAQHRGGWRRQKVCGCR